MDATMMTSPGPRLSSMCVPVVSILRKNRGVDLAIRKLGFPGGADSKEYACNTGDLGLIPGKGRSPGGGMATHSSILSERGVWQVTVPGVAKSRT